MSTDHRTGPQVVVAGHLRVAAAERASYLDGCREVVRLARASPGCLDFALSADLLDQDRINILERWESRAAVEAFRGSGPSDEQAAQVLDADVVELDVTAERRP